MLFPNKNTKFEWHGMSQKNNKELLHYWNSIRGSRAAPKRIEISPAAISHILPKTFILEVKNPDDFSFRLAGSKICDMFGSEFRGQNFFTQWPKNERLILKKYLRQLVDEGAVVSTIFSAHSEHNHQGQFEMLFLPMIHSGSHIDRILGTVVPLDEYPWIGLAKLKFAAINEVHISILNQAALNKHHNSSVEPLSFHPSARLVSGDHCQLRVFDGGKSQSVTKGNKNED